MAMDYQTYENYKVIEDLQNLVGQHTELITLYVNYKRPINEVIDYLKQEKAESENIKNKINRRNVVGAIDKIIGLLKTNPDMTKGLCIFADSYGVRWIKPNKPNTLNKYYCGKEYYLEPAKMLLAEQDCTYGLVVLDGGECTIATLSGSQVIIHHEIDSCVTNRTIKGGQSARRYRNARQESLGYYYEEVSHIINQTFTPEIKKIYYGGILPSSEEYLKELPGINPLLKPKFTLCYPIPYCDRMGIKCLLAAIQEDIEDAKYQESLAKREFLESMVTQQLHCTRDSGNLGYIGINEDHVHRINLQPNDFKKYKIEIFLKDSAPYEYIETLFEGVIYLKK
jgi:peptide chain release factor 1